MVPMVGQDTTCPALLIAHSMRFVYGAVTLYRAPFQTLPLTHMLIQALGSSRSLAATGESRLISFPRGT